MHTYTDIGLRIADKQQQGKGEVRKVSGPELRLEIQRRQLRMWNIKAREYQ